MHARGSISRLAERIDLHPILVFCFVSAVYLTFALFLVQTRPFGEDEFHTLYECRLPTASALWSFLGNSSEGQTAWFMLLTQRLAHGLGDAPLVLRMPGLIGYWATIAGIYGILVSRCGALWAGFGALLALSARSAPFAAEARSYGLVLGAGTVALWCWLRARRQPSRFAYIFLAAACTVAAATHYYSVFVPVPLAIAQFVHDRRRGEMQWPMWLAFAAAALPNLAALPIIRGTHALANFWSPPRPMQLGETMMNVLGPEFGCLLAVGLTAALCARGLPEARPLDTEEQIAYWGFVALPLLGWLFAVLVTHAYVERYVPQSLIGIAVLFGLGLSARFGPGSRAALIAFAAMCCLCVFLCAARIQNARRERAAIDETAAAVRALGLPVASSSVEVWLRLNFYQNRAAQFVYLFDPELSLQYDSQNMMETQLRDHAALYPASLNSFRSFTAQRRPFVVLSVDAFHPEWLALELTAEKWNLRLLGRAPLGTLFLAEPPR